jgi:hypothetical protein
MDWETQRKELAAIVATFPETFEMETGPGRSREPGLKFRVDAGKSFYDRSCGFQLVTQVWSEERQQWLDYSRGSVEELRGLVKTDQEEPHEAETDWEDYLRGEL